MRILITGRGSSGSWKMRGEQLGAALGATVLPNADAATIRAHDVVIGVKRVPLPLRDLVRQERKLFVWDVVDAWPQPEGNHWDRLAATRWLHEAVAMYEPDGIIAATKAMENDLPDEHPRTTIYHHGRETTNPLREKVKVVGYEGGDYLGSWRGLVERHCMDRGWEFRINCQPQDADIQVALRNAYGHPALYWKSNVKLANCQTSGTPVIMAPEAGYLETASGGEYVVTSALSLKLSFEWLTPHDNRVEAAARLRTKAYTVAQAAADTRAFLETLL